MPKPHGDITTRSALERVLKKRDRVFVLFYASWCPFCVTFLPIFLKRAAKNPDLFATVRDDRETISDTFGIEVFPTVLLFEKGGITGRLDGILGSGIRSEDFTAFVGF